VSVRTRYIFSLCTALLLAGCGPSPDPSFVLSSKTDELFRDARTPVVKALEENFGSPNNLVVWAKLPLDYGKAEPEVAGHEEAGWKIKHGRNLYMVHCLHCHGVSGDGNGTTAKFLEPRPRDYRNGVFKFTSTLSGLKPSRNDLKVILQNGIPGSTMPSFVLLKDDELDAIIEYVRFLSMRGEYEIKLVNEMSAMGGVTKDIERRIADGRKDKENGETRESILQELNEAIEGDLPDLQDSIASDLAEDWNNAESPDSQVLPELERVAPTAESLARGKDLYYSKKAKCVDCHGLSGRGDGALTEDYWDVPNTTPAQKYHVRGLHDVWGNPQQPRDLTRGLYRGGRRPLDLYRRVFAGIKGTQMPAFGGTVLNDTEIWDIVNYVMSLPFDGKVSAAPAPEEAPSQEEKVAVTGR